MKDYSKMSDFEINKAVAINRGGYQGHVEHMEHGVKESDRDSHGIFYFERDYCNNPSDAWPIIVANRINVYASEGPDFMPWMAGCGGMVASNRNPIRAAMIVFLMMQEQAK